MNKYKKLWYRYIRNPIKNAWYWFRCHTYTRYHMLDMRDKANGYSWGWYDRSELLIYANFAVLRDFIEKEQPFSLPYKPLPLNGDECYNADVEDWNKANQELYYLYIWWTERRPKDYKALKDMYLSYLKDQSLDPLMEEERLAKVDNEMMVRLINARKAMWT